MESKTVSRQSSAESEATSGIIFLRSTADVTLLLNVKEQRGALSHDHDCETWRGVCVFQTQGKTVWNSRHQTQTWQLKFSVQGNESRPTHVDIFAYFALFQAIFGGAFCLPHWQLCLLYINISFSSSFCVWLNSKFLHLSRAGLVSIKPPVGNDSEV